jgi:hypothetical protein
MTYLRLVPVASRRAAGVSDAATFRARRHVSSVHLDATEIGALLADAGPERA